MAKRLGSLIAVCFAACAATPVPSAPVQVEASAVAERITIAAFGDVPYAEDPLHAHRPTVSPAWDDLMRRIELERPAFAVHVGDLKQGGTECTDAYFARMRQAFDAFPGSLLYTPGDNDWTDCHFVREAVPDSSFTDPNERLAALRRTFFSGQTSLGTKSLPLREQSKEFPENRMWRVGSVVYATLHVVGSNNNADWPYETERLGDMQEFRARDAANLAWVAEVNAEARRTNSQALVWFTQGDLQFERFAPSHQTDAKDPQGKVVNVEHVNGFYNVVRALYETSGAASYPTMLVHGDYHVFRVRRPAPHLLAVEVPGEPHVDFTRLALDLGSARPFWAGLGSMHAEGAAELRLRVQSMVEGNRQIEVNCLEGLASAKTCSQVRAAIVEIEPSSADCGASALAVALRHAEERKAPLLVLSSSMEPDFTLSVDPRGCSVLRVLRTELAEASMPVIWTHPAATSFVDQPLKPLGEERLALLSRFARVGVAAEVAVRLDGKGVAFGL